MGRKRCPSFSDGRRAKRSPRPRPHAPPVRQALPRRRCWYRNIRSGITGSRIPPRPRRRGRQALRERFDRRHCAGRAPPRQSRRRRSRCPNHCLAELWKLLRLRRPLPLPCANSRIALASGDSPKPSSGPTGAIVIVLIGSRGDLSSMKLLPACAMGHYWSAQRCRFALDQSLRGIGAK